MKIGIFGGTFDPVHNGHLIAAESVGELLGIEKMYVIPAFIPPHKHRRDITSAAQRLKMVSLAVADNPRFVASDIELSRSGSSFTIDTVEHFRSEGELYLIMGHDSFMAFETWRRFEDLLAMCRIVLVVRPDCEPLEWSRFGRAISDCHNRTQFVISDCLKPDTKLRSSAWKIALITIPGIGISSTEIRFRVATGRSVRYLVPSNVEHYIKANDLYRDDLH